MKAAMKYLEDVEEGLEPGWGEKVKAQALLGLMNSIGLEMRKLVENLFSRSRRNPDVRRNDHGHL